MMENVEIADAIDNNTTDSAYDEYCKKILSNKQVLAHILKVCVREYADVPLEEILSYIEHDPMLNVSMEDSEAIKGRDIEDKSVFGAEIRYDILFDAKLPHSSKEERIGSSISKHKITDKQPIRLSQGLSIIAVDYWHVKRIGKKVL